MGRGGEFPLGWSEAAGGGTGETGPGAGFGPLVTVDSTAGLAALAWAGGIGATVLRVSVRWPSGTDLSSGSMLIGTSLNQTTRRLALGMFISGEWATTLPSPWR